MYVLKGPCLHDPRDMLRLAGSYLHVPMLLSECQHLSSMCSSQCLVSQGPSVHHQLKHNAHEDEVFISIFIVSAPSGAHIIISSREPISAASCTPDIEMLCEP